MELEVGFSLPSGNSRNTVEDSKCGCNFLTEIAQLDENHWIFKGTACHPSQMLHGPASLKDSRVIIYPCNKNKCIIKCPCFICRSIKLVNPLDKASFANNQLYHQAPACHNCCETLRLDPLKSFKQVSDAKSWGSRTTVKWMFYHQHIWNHGKAYKDYMWKKDFGDKKEVNFDEFFLKQLKQLIVMKILLTMLLLMVLVILMIMKM